MCLKATGQHCHCSIFLFLENDLILHQFCENYTRHWINIINLRQTRGLFFSSPSHLRAVRFNSNINRHTAWHLKQTVGTVEAIYIMQLYSNLLRFHCADGRLILESQWRAFMSMSDFTHTFCTGLPIRTKVRSR